MCRTDVTLALARASEVFQDRSRLRALRFHARPGVEEMSLAACQQTLAVEGKGAEMLVAFAEARTAWEEQTAEGIVHFAELLPCYVELAAADARCLVVGLASNTCLQAEAGFVMLDAWLKGLAQQQALGFRCLEDCLQAQAIREAVARGESDEFA